MEKQTIYTILQDVASALIPGNPDLNPFPESLDESAVISSFGVDEVVFSEIVDGLENRFGNRNLQIRKLLNGNDFQTLTFGEFLTQIQRDVGSKIKDPIVVYVDDEEENLFVFKRKMGRHLKLETFTEPYKALEFIKSNPQVALVITDEVMPGLGGNSLCDEVRKLKPFMRFILITGNPDHDENLLHKTLRGNRFFEFINKPLDLANKGEDYLRIIQEAMA